MNEDGIHELIVVSEERCLDTSCDSPCGARIKRLRVNPNPPRAVLVFLSKAVILVNVVMEKRNALLRNGLNYFSPFR